MWISKPKQASPEPGHPTWPGRPNNMTWKTSANLLQGAGDSITIFAFPSKVKKNSRKLIEENSTPLFFSTPLYWLMDTTKHLCCFCYGLRVTMTSRIGIMNKLPFSPRTGPKENLSYIDTNSPSTKNPCTLQVILTIDFTYSSIDRSAD